MTDISPHVQVYDNKGESVVFFHGQNLYNRKDRSVKYISNLSTDPFYNNLLPRINWYDGVDNTFRGVSCIFDSIGTLTHGLSFFLNFDDARKKSYDIEKKNENDSTRVTVFHIEGKVKVVKREILSSSPPRAGKGRELIFNACTALRSVFVPDKFIGSIEGHFRFTQHYEAEHVINTGIIVGHVLIRTAFDSRFYVSYEMSEEGKLIGPVTRTALIPEREYAEEGEYLSEIIDNRAGLEKVGLLTPVYVSYYHPESGKRVYKREYAAYLHARRDAIIEATSLPHVLGDLLGYL